MAETHGRVACGGMMLFMINGESFDPSRTDVEDQRMMDVIRVQ